jgi:hypothetical protein
VERSTITLGRTKRKIMTYGIDIHGQELTEAEVNTLKASGKRFDVKDGQRIQFTDVEETARDEKDKVVLASYDAYVLANDYKDKRLAEYPKIEELVVALYDTDDKAAIEKRRSDVKAKYPKPE